MISSKQLIIALAIFSLGVSFGIQASPGNNFGERYFDVEYEELALRDIIFIEDASLLDGLGMLPSLEALQKHIEKFADYPSHNGGAQTYKDFSSSLQGAFIDFLAGRDIFFIVDKNEYSCEDKEVEDYCDGNWDILSFHLCPDAKMAGSGNPVIICKIVNSELSPEESGERIREIVAKIIEFLSLANTEKIFTGKQGVGRGSLHCDKAVDITVLATE